MKNKFSFLLMYILFFSMPIWPASYPAVDSFSGSGALSSNWTNTVATAETYVPAEQLNGTAVPNVSGQHSLATYTGVSFTGNQYAQAKFVTHSSAGGSTGPCVRMSTTGNGVCYLGDWGIMYVLTNGTGNHGIPVNCPIPASGDTIQLLAVGTTYTCTDETTGATASGTDSTYTTGNPGMLLDQRNSPVYALAQFQADCSPSCGVVPASYPAVDSFSGSGALSSNWTNTVATAETYVPAEQLNGTAVPNVSGQHSLATYTGVSFTGNQYAQAKFVTHSSAGGSTGPCVRMSTTGNGVCYLGDWGIMYVLTNGTGNHGIPVNCPIPASGDTIQLLAVGTTYTCTDETTGATASGTDSTYTTGNPGMLLDQRNSPVYALAQFQADCSPSCGVVPASYPAVDSFSGSGALSSNWTNTVATAETYVPAEQLNGTAVPNVSGQHSLATYTGVSFTGNQYAQAKFVTHSSAGGSTGPCVRMSTTGNGVCYLGDWGIMYVLTNGTGNHGIPVNCPIPASGDTIQLLAVGTTYTCTDETTGATASGTDSTYTTGNPGMLLDQRNSPVYALAQFQADCSPSCGSSAASVSGSGSSQPVITSSGSSQPVSSGTTAPPVLPTANMPGFSPISGTYSASQSVTISTSTPSATIYYTTNGSTPTAGSMVYSGPIPVTTNETIEAIVVASGYTTSATGSATYTIDTPATKVTSIAISPQGAAILSGATQQFTVVCTYLDGTKDNCAKAGGARWSSSLSSAMTVNSSGLATWVTDPGVGNTNIGYVLVSAEGYSDRAGVYAQHPGDTWYQYVTPDYEYYNNSITGSQYPINVVVGSTVTVGMGLEINNNGSGGQPTGQPFQASCNWTSSDASIATVNREGLATAISPGTVSIICGHAGNAVFGNSAMSGWIAPGNGITLNVVAGGTGNTTWYVRPDGGTVYSATNTSGQCSGKVNAPLVSAAGVNQACAAGNIRYLWSDGVTYQQLQWIISGGDTVIVAQNPTGYNMGADEPQSVSNYAPTNCAGNYSGCFMPSIPSGTAAQHTRILGANYANCHADSQKTLLIESYSEYMGINVSDSQFVDVACFEVTDKAACTPNGNYTNDCTGNDNFGENGIFQSAMTSNVTYTDMLIHGLGGDGIHGATGVGIVANYVHIRAMPDAGINMDDDPWLSGNISVAGGFTLTNSITEFTGCVEEYPVVHNYPYVECRDQNTGAYGDGFGTASTTGDWYFDHDTWQYNYQDGLDLLHSGMNSLTVTNSFSQGNEGQSYKIGSGNTILFQNNLALDDCNRLGYVIGDEPASAVAPGGTGGENYSLCRAAGDWIIFSFTNQGSYTVQNNTIAGYGATTFDLFCEGGWDFCSNASTTFQNNIVLGYSDTLYNQGQLPGLFYEENSSMPPNGAWATRNNNLYYNMRYEPSLLTGELGADPLLVEEPALTISTESDLDNFNFQPSSGSPAIGAGVSITGLTADHNGATLPNPPNIGALD